jgi:cyclomaltodextrinase
VNKDIVKGQAYQPYPALKAKEYREKIEALLRLYPWEIQLTQLNLLDSHDTARLITIASEEQASVELATLLLFTFRSIYYGDEVGLEGGRDPDSRRGFPQEEFWNLEVLNYQKRSIEIRQAYAALQTGSYQVLYAEDSVYVFTRILGKQELIIAVNTSMEAVDICFPVEALQTQPDHIIYGKGEAFWNITGGVNQLELSIPHRTGLILA